FSIDMIDLFGVEEVYNKEYEVEDCHVYRNSPMCTPCKKCSKLMHAAFNKLRQELMKELEPIIGSIIDTYTKEIEQIYDSAIDDMFSGRKLVYKSTIKNSVLSNDA
ncbi:15698_t:CDS:2, partial [Acaulospora morrowiae]